MGKRIHGPSMLFPAFVGIVSGKLPLLGLYAIYYVVLRLNRSWFLLPLLFLYRIVELMYHGVASTAEGGLSRAPSTATSRYIGRYDGR